LSSVKDLIIPIGIGVLTFLGLFFAPGSFLIHPTFEIEFEKKGTLEFITVTNTGWIQAKNVMIHLKPGIVTQVQLEDCPEGVLAKDWEFSSSAKIELVRMSPNLECFFLTFIDIPAYTERITVTADDSPAYAWEFEEQTTQPLSVLIQSLSTVAITIIAIIISTIVYRVSTRRSIL